MSWDDVNQSICKMSEQVQIAERSMSSGIAVFGAGPHSMVHEYRLAIRQHSPNLMETTLYCWVETERCFYES